MSNMIWSDDISIRTILLPGDIGYVTYLHGDLYRREYGYGIEFEAYVAQGLCEFYKNYDPQRDCVWIAEHQDRMVGFLLLMHRGAGEAQLRYFLLHPEYRGIGLGRKMASLFIEFLRTHGYKRSFLWTTHEQSVAAGLYIKMGYTLTEEKASTAFGKPLIEQRYDLVDPWHDFAG